MNYLSKVSFNTGSDSEPYLSIDSTSTLGYTGFRGRVFAQEGTCMLFDLGHEAYHPFWMSQVPFPLDVIFIGKDLTVVDVVKGLPNDEEPFTSKVKASYVVETVHGWCERNNIEEGTKVEFLSIWDHF